MLCPTLILTHKKASVFNLDYRPSSCRCSEGTQLLACRTDNMLAILSPQILSVDWRSIIKAIVYQVKSFAIMGGKSLVWLNKVLKPDKIWEYYILEHFLVMMVRGRFVWHKRRYVIITCWQDSSFKMNAPLLNYFSRDLEPSYRDSPEKSV